MSDPPLILVHGVGLDRSMWDLIMEPLETARTVIRYDLIGHGSTPPAARGDLTLEDLVGQLVDVIDGCGHAQPDVCGLSIGGLIAMATAARHPERIGRLVLLNTVFDRTVEQVAGARARLELTERDGLEPIGDLAVDRWFTADWQRAHPDRVTAVRDRLTTNDLQAYVQAYRVFVEGDPTMPGAASAITSPTTAITGEHDPGSTPAMSHAIAAAVPSGRAVVLDGLHHLPPIEAPDVCATALLNAIHPPDAEEIS